jgi:hypothetical protein
MSPQPVVEGPIQPDRTCPYSGLTIDDAAADR